MEKVDLLIHHAGPDQFQASAVGMTRAGHTWLKKNARKHMEAIKKEALEAGFIVRETFSDHEETTHPQSVK